MILEGRLRPRRDGRWTMHVRLDDGGWATVSAVPDFLSVVHHLDRLDGLGRQAGPGSEGLLSELYELERRVAPGGSILISRPGLDLVAALA